MTRQGEDRMHTHTSTRATGGGMESLPLGLHHSDWGQKKFPFGKWRTLKLQVHKKSSYIRYCIITFLTHSANFVAIIFIEHLESLHLSK